MHCNAAVTVKPLRTALPANDTESLWENLQQLLSVRTIRKLRPIDTTRIRKKIAPVKHAESMVKLTLINTMTSYQRARDETMLTSPQETHEL